MPTKHGFITLAEDRKAQETKANYEKNIAQSLDNTVTAILEELATANGWAGVQARRDDNTWVVEHDRHNKIEVILYLTASVSKGTSSEFDMVMQGKMYTFEVNHYSAPSDGFIYDNNNALGDVLIKALGA